MESPKEAGAPQTPPGRARHSSYSSDNSTIYGSDIEKDLESQTIKPPQRSLSNLWRPTSPPIISTLDEIDEEDLVDSEDEDTADVSAMDYQRSASMAYTCNGNATILIRAP